MDLHVKSYAIKFPEKNIEENLCYFGIGKDFLDTTLKALSMKEFVLFLW